MEGSGSYCNLFVNAWESGPAPETPFPQTTPPATAPAGGLELKDSADIVAELFPDHGYNCRQSTRTGPPKVREQIHHDANCPSEKPLCGMYLNNHDDGTRVIDYKCLSMNECYSDWFLGTSDSDRCQTWKPGFIKTVAYECTYCCAGDHCNAPASPLDINLILSNPEVLFNGNRDDLVALAKKSGLHRRLKGQVSLNR